MKKEKNKFYKLYNLNWVVKISIWTFFLAIIFSLIAENVVQNFNIFFAFITLILIITLGIIFDTIGIAVAKAEEKPFHAMAARKIEEAKLAIKLVRNASTVSNICNDVVGDISGIISGAIGATLVLKLINAYEGLNLVLITTLMTAFVAAFTVGGKALGKAIALLYYEKIVFKIAKILNVIEVTFKIDIFPNKNKKE